MSSDLAQVPREKLNDLISVVRSINRGRHHEVRIGEDGDLCYWQRKEWVDWALEVAESLAAEASIAQHPDDAAVDRFAVAMKAKLAAARAKGRGGWDDPAQCSVEFLAKLLVDHVGKGNSGTFEDVANFAMMLHQRGADPQVLANVAAVQEALALPEGITIDKDFFGTVHIKLGDFDFIQIQYDHRYTYNSHQDWVANKIVEALYGPSVAEHSTQAGGLVESLSDGSNALLRRKLIAMQEPGSNDQN